MASFPNSGLFGTISYRDNRKTLGADNDFRQMKFEFGGAGTFGRYTIFSRALFETTLDNVSLDNKPANELLFRGGYLELSGTVRNELFGQHFGLIEAVFYRRLGDITFFPIYTGFSLEAGNAWLEASDINTENIRLAGSVFIGADTFLGPIYIAIGATDKGESAFYLNIGVPFLKNN